MSETILNGIMQGFWRDLAPHAERGAILLVDAELDLLDVAQKTAKDDTAAIGAWLNQKKLAKPVIEQLEAWNRTPDRPFRFVIVAPYVFIQEIGH